MTLASAEAWGDIVPWTVYCYWRRRMSQSSTSQFELLYDVAPQMALEERLSSNGDSQDNHCLVESLPVSDERAKRNE